jgi:glutathione-specific gamma-glutamylcyclotransferase
MTTMRHQRMALTQDLVARTIRDIADAGLIPGTVPMTDDDYRQDARKLLKGAPSGDLWFFGYGSLLWKPASCTVAESRPALVRGWHRAFCFKVLRFRGTMEQPGLMMALDRGGQCRGIAFRLPCDDAEAGLEALLRREMLVKAPLGHLPRWLAAETDQGPIRALGFVANRTGPRYTGRLALEHVADILAIAAGHAGSCAQYLHETVARLEELGIRDRNLWRLQALVAERIAAMDAAAGQPMTRGASPPA